MTLEEAARKLLADYDLTGSHEPVRELSYDIEALRAALSAPRQGEPWGWAVSWPGHMLDCEGDAVDRLTFCDALDAQAYVDGLVIEEGDAEPIIHELFPLYAGAPPTAVSHICSDGKEKPWPKAAWCPQCSQPPGPDVLSVDGKPREIMGEASKHGAPPANKEDDALDAPTVAALRPEVAEELIRDGIPPGEIILSAPAQAAEKLEGEFLVDEDILKKIKEYNAQGKRFEIVEVKLPPAEARGYHENELPENPDDDKRP